MTRCHLVTIHNIIPLKHVADVCVTSQLKWLISLQISDTVFQSGAFCLWKSTLYIVSEGERRRAKRWRELAEGGAQISRQTGSQAEENAGWKGQKIGQWRHIPAQRTPRLLECKVENMGGYGGWDWLMHLGGWRHCEYLCFCWRVNEGNSEFLQSGSSLKY